MQMRAGVLDDFDTPSFPWERRLELPLGDRLYLVTVREVEIAKPLRLMSQERPPLKVVAELIVATAARLIARKV
jgi:hypothetical protein